MSLYKRGAVWWIRFTTPDGREVRETARTADRKQAQEYHDRRKADSWRIAQLGERPRYTWQQAVVRWLEEHADRKAMDSVLAYLRQAHVTLGDLYLDQITVDRLSQAATTYRAPAWSDRTLLDIVSLHRLLQCHHPSLERH